MSAETLEWLNTQILVGFTDPQYGRGEAWHYRADLQGDEPNHYQHAIPVDDVLRRLYAWSAIEAPVYVKVGDDNFVQDENRKAIVRSDDNTIFGVFKSSYQAHQYPEWLLKNVANLIDDDEFAIGTAGNLRKGGKSFVTIELPETIVTPSGFGVRPHLLACTSHDGTLASTYQLVTTVVVCDNTLAGALGENTPQYKVRHSKHSIGRLQNVRDALNIVHQYTDSLLEEIDRLSAQVVTDNEFQAIVEHLVPVDLGVDTRPQVQSRAQNKQELLRHIYKNDPMVAPWTGTALGVLQTWNTYQHHHAGSNDNRSERNMLNGILGKTEANDRLVLETIKNLVMA